MRINNFVRHLLSASAATLFFLTLPVAGQTPQFIPNYDESKVGAFTLPDPLKMNDGRKVTNARLWRERRQEIIKLYETHVYGRTPAAAKAARISFAETSRDTKALGGLATRKEVTVYLAGKKDGPKMSVLFYIPNDRKQPAPVFIGLNFNGNQAIRNDPGIALATSWLRDGKETGAVNNRATENSRGTEASRWAVEMIVKRGYAVATIYNGDLFPDHKDGLKDSVVPHFYRSGQTQLEADDWNALAAWAWGLNRAVDY
ncbi:MAG: acetylxylan esterase, partial [Acidobacteriota bacterium]